MGAIVDGATSRPRSRHLVVEQVGVLLVVAGPVGEERAGDRGVEPAAAHVVEGSPGERASQPSALEIVVHLGVGQDDLVAGELVVHEAGNRAVDVGLVAVLVRVVCHVYIAGHDAPPFWIRSGFGALRCYWLRRCCSMAARTAGATSSANASTWCSGSVAGPKTKVSIPPPTTRPVSSSTH